MYEITISVVINNVLLELRSKYLFNDYLQLLLFYKSGVHLLQQRINTSKAMTRISKILQKFPNC